MSSLARALAASHAPSARFRLHTSVTNKLQPDERTTPQPAPDVLASQARVQPLFLRARPPSAPALMCLVFWILRHIKTTRKANERRLSISGPPPTCGRDCVKAAMLVKSCCPTCKTATTRRGVSCPPPLPAPSNERKGAKPIPEP